MKRWLPYLNVGRVLKRILVMLRVLFFFTIIVALIIFVYTFTLVTPATVKQFPLQEEIAPSAYAPQGLPVCNSRFTHIAPCLKTDNYTLYQEWHCLPGERRLNCLVPPPHGYKLPITWPNSINQTWYSNVLHQRLAVKKIDQPWMKIVGDRVLFSNNITGFPDGVEKYVASLAMMVKSNNGDLSNSGKIRTVLDIGCGVASFGGYLLSNDILTMSIAPHDIHEQIQFALERGIPATLGILGSRKLPYPSKAFDMVHCSWCNIDWTDRNGILLLEVDRLLKPEGFFIWRSGDDKGNVSMLANRMCWSLIAEQEHTAMWEKPSNSCYYNEVAPRLCDSRDDADASWQTPLKDCLVPMETAAGYQVKPWPERLKSPPARLQELKMNRASFRLDTGIWKKRVKFYWKSLESQLEPSSIRNVLDMNADLGGFAAALINKPVWVMNVVPTTNGTGNRLGVIYDRGLIGSLHNWCQPFPSYPRTYDLIHAFYIISEASARCGMEIILLEMDRLLRPFGFVIVSDEPETMASVTKYLPRLRWDIWSDEASLGEISMLFARKHLWEA